MSTNDQPIVLATTKTLVTRVDGSMSVTLDIPQEYKKQAFLLLGEPGVSVGIAPLTQEATQRVSRDAFKRYELLEDQAAVEGLNKPKDRQAFTGMKRAQQAGIRCNEPAFWAYLAERFAEDVTPFATVIGPDSAAEAVRWYCRVDSRRDLDNPHGAAGALWDALEADFYATQHGMH